MVSLIDFILSIDIHLGNLINEYGLLIYAILFAIVFIETGLVIMPFLPGDSLLFAAGAFAAIGDINLLLVILIFVIAAILGDSLNYYLGLKAGPAIFRKESGIFFNKKYLVATDAFYKKHGGKSIIIARFLPFIRTFAPFVAGIGKMNYARFLGYNIGGGILWVLLFVLGGYFFGTIPIVKENFSLVILLIIIISVAPIIIKALIHFLKKRKLRS